MRSSSLADLFGGLVGNGETPSHVLAVREAADAVLVAMAGLAEDRRTAIRLRYLEGRSIGEIAAQMERTETSVHSLLFHGCQQLRELLGPASRYVGRSAPDRSVLPN
jgi:DNA-directed RNA polymerase specialized sigma24 family protein